MAVLLGKLWLSYDLISEQLPDPRTKSWPLVAKPLEGLLILTIYALFVLKWGPSWMKNRPAYNMDKLLIIHNIVQVVANGYIFYELVIYAWGKNYKWTCEPVDYSDDPTAMNIARTVYHYYLVKYLDLMDTIFFVLRKKFSQVSFLHVFHHISMVIVAWGATTYLAGGHGTLVGLINTFVHVIMYTYYLLTVIDPSIKNSVWWKKHLTQLQIVQLAIICLHLSLLLVIPNCGYPAWISFAIIPGNFSLLLLFTDFYINTYIRPNRKATGTNGKDMESNSAESVTKTHRLLD